MALQATVSPSRSSLFIQGIYRPIISVKVRRNTCFGSSNSSSMSVAASSQAPSLVSHNQDPIVRPLENYSPDMWDDHFINLPFTNSELESCSRNVEYLEKKVNDMLMSSTDDPIQKVLLINSLCRLGVSYHFETEIEEQLSHLYTILPQLMEHDDYNLHIVAVIFQLFRSHGYKVPSDTFNKFKKSDGTFGNELVSDIQGIISLYEASYWATHGENILDEALVFTTSHLESLVVSQSCPDHLREYIKNALNRCYHHGTPRVEARQYISYYENDESRNKTILMFAKYDFNRVQMLHQQELSLLSSWWKKSDTASRFPHVRQRIVESFFVAVETMFEPRFALARSVMTKWYLAFALLDDTYDAYGLFEELQHFTKALKRFDRRAIDELPGDYFKNIYETILNISDEVEEEVSSEKRTYSASYFKEEIKRVVETYDVQARWTHEQIVPPLDEYLENGLRSVGTITTMVLLMMGMEEADEDAYRWVINCDDKFLRASCLLCRLYNDIQSDEDEMKRGKFSWIACYRKEYGVSREEAIGGCRERIRVAWKEMNDGFMVTPMPVSKQILMQAFNLVRISDILYENDDGFTKQISLKQYITKVLIDAIPLEG